jgi:hypothetical protein
MTDLAWMLVVQIALLRMLDYLLPNMEARGRNPRTSWPATAPLSEQTARRMIERAYASTAPGESGGTGWR